MHSPTLFSGTKLTILDTQETVTVDEDSAAVAVPTGTRGEGIVVLSVEHTGADTDETLDVTVMHGTTTTTTAHTDILQPDGTAAAFTQIVNADSIQYIVIDMNGVKDFISLDYNTAGTTPGYQISAALITGGYGQLVSGNTF